MGRKARIELDVRHHHPEAIRPDQAHSMSLGRPLGQVSKRARPVAETSRDDERAGTSELARLINDAGDCRRRRGNDHKFG
jgi:hypothetical protein